MPRMIHILGVKLLTTHTSLCVCTFEKINQTVTFQRFDDLQAVGQVWPGSRGVTGVTGASIGVVGAGWCHWTGGQAVIWCQEATRTLIPFAVCGQGTQFPLTLHIEERPLRRMVLLASWQAAQGGFKVLASRSAWLAQSLWPTDATGKEKKHENVKRMTLAVTQKCVLRFSGAPISFLGWTGAGLFL